MKDMERQSLAALLACLAVALLAAPAAAEDYPTLGWCTGNAVRLRDEPSTGKDSKIIGKVNDVDLLIVLGETSVDGDTWYEVERPKQKGTAWIFGKYVATDEGDAVGTPAYNMAVRIRMTFGQTPEKAKALLGKPRKETKGKFWFEPGAQNLTRAILEYPDFKLEYVQDQLRHVNVSGGMTPFGDIRIGDRMERVRDVLGPPSEEGNEGWSYEVSPVERILFEERGGKVHMMTWDEYLDG